jgi:mucin-19
MMRFSLSSRSFGLACATLVAGLALLSACGGGGGGSIVPSSGSGTSGSKSGAAPEEHIGFSFLVPKSATTAIKAFKRVPQYISSGTASITIIAVPASGSPVPTQVTLPAGLTGTNSAGTATCTTVSGGSQCTVDVNAPGGTDTFQATFYDSSGAALSTGMVTGQAISATGSNPVTITFNGIPATITVSLVNPTPLPMATATTIPIAISVQDASGATILSPGNYAYPITLISSGSAHLSVPATPIAAPPSPGATPYSYVSTYDGANADQFTLGVPYITASVAPGSVNGGTSVNSSPLPAPSIIPATLVPLTVVSPVAAVTYPPDFTRGSGANLRGVAYDPSNNGIYVAAYGDNTIQVYDATSGSLVAVIGAQNPNPSSSPLTMSDGSYSGTSTPAPGDGPTLCETGNIVYDQNDGNLYFADAGYNAIREITPTSETAGAVTTIAGPVSGSVPSPAATACAAINQTGYVDGTGSAAYDHGVVTSGPLFHAPYGITFDSKNNMLYVSETGNDAIRQVTTELSTSGCYTGITQQAGCVESVAGAITSQNAPGNGYTPVSGSQNGSGAGGTGTAAEFDSPYGLTYDSCDNNIYVADTSNNVVREVALGNGSSGTGAAASAGAVAVTTLIGTAPTTGTSNGAPTGTGTNPTATLNKPLGIAADQISCDLYLTDFNNELVRKITTQDSYGGLATAATITTYAGIAGTNSDINGYAGTATFGGPFTLVWVNTASNPFGPTLYEIDNGASLLRKIF